MTARRKEELAPLAAAAAALEEELAALEAAARQAERVPLTSRRHVEDAAARLATLSTAEERIRPHAARFAAAMAATVERQRALGEAVAARAREVEARREALRGLLDRYEQLGRGAAEVNALARGASAGPGPHGGAPPIVDVAAVGERIGALAEGARSLAQAAHAERFADLDHEADALAQQLHALRNRLTLLGERMRSQAAS